MHLSHTTPSDQVANPFISVASSPRTPHVVIHSLGTPSDHSVSRLESTANLLHGRLVDSFSQPGTSVCCSAYKRHES